MEYRMSLVSEDHVDSASKVPSQVSKGKRSHASRHTAVSFCDRVKSVQSLVDVSGQSSGRLIR